MTSMICQAVAGTAFARIHVGAAQQMGGVQQASPHFIEHMASFVIKNEVSGGFMHSCEVSKVIGCSGILLIASTFGAFGS